MPKQQFIVMRSPAENTHGLMGFNDKVKKLPNVTVLERLAPHEMPALYQQVRMVLVPSRYETYGMAGLEGLAHGRPTIHVNTPHALEGVGADFCIGSVPTVAQVMERIHLIENDYDTWRIRALTQATVTSLRQADELSHLTEWVLQLRHQNPDQRQMRRRHIRQHVGSQR